MEPQQQSPWTSTSAASEPQPSSTAASAASDPPRHQNHGDPINLTGGGLSSEPARAVAGGIDTAGIDKGLWQPNKRAVAFYWRFFWKSMLTYDTPMTGIGGIALWAPATINENISWYHMYQVLGVPVHVIVPRNCNNTAVCVKITPHLTCACNMPSRSKSVYCGSYMHVVYVTGTDRRNRVSGSPVLAQVPTTVIIYTCGAMYIVENMTQNREI